MFTGIIEELGRVRSLSIQGISGVISIQAHRVLEGTQIGDSISVNGVCLTVVSLGADGFTADVMAETARRSNLGSLAPGELVNLERAMEAGKRFGGHIVSGHVDGTGTILSRRKEENGTWIRIGASPQVLRLIVPKGSIAIDGISLTVAKVSDGAFSVSIIPHTGQETTLLQKKIGASVNLENDVIGKYVEQLLGFSGKQEGEPERESGGITMEMLRALE